MAFLAGWVLPLSALTGYSQARPHQLISLKAGGPGQVQIELDGDAGPDFQPFFDILWVESSQDLVHWQATDSALHTNGNASSTQLSLPSGETARYFRVVTNACPTALPKPTGPYLVGTVSRLLSSATRNTTAPGTNREFMVSVFYPASPAAWSAPTPYLEPLWEQILYSKEFLTTDRADGLATNMVSHALPDFPILSGTNRFPVLLYAHGGQYFRRDNIHKLTELASHGYVVISADYYDAYLSILPDGTPAVYDPVPNDFPHVLLSNTLHDWSVGDTRFLLDELGRMDLSDPRFKDRLDLGRIGAMGWSFGGAVAADICRADSRVRAAVLYDAAFWSSPDVNQFGIGKPFLCMNSALAPTPDWAAPAISLVNRAARDAYFFKITGAAHEDFCDLTLIDLPSPFLFRTTDLILSYTLAFFEHYLKGTSQPLLNGPPTGTQIYNWIQK